MSTKRKKSGGNPAKAKAKASFADRRKNATPDEITVFVCLDRRLHNAYREAVIRLEQINAAKKPTLLDGTPHDMEEAAQRVVELADRLNAASEPYSFRKLPRTRWRALADQHPPTDEQLAKAKEVREDDPNYPLPNVDALTFWPAAVAATAFDPELTVEDAEWLRDGDEDWPGLPDDKWDEIIASVQQLHEVGGDVPKEWIDTAKTLRSALSGTTRSNTESPSQSSEDASPQTESPTG